MFSAVKQGEHLAAPTVGKWQPSALPGTLLRSGVILGHLVRAGRRWPVVVPDGMAGTVAKVTTDSWVEYGALLVEVGTGAVEFAPVALAEDSGLPAGVIEVVAESDGTIYLSPDPHSPPFAAVHQAVGAKGTLALIEVMKTFSPVRSPVAGQVEKVWVSSGAGVQAGTALFWIRTS